MIQLTPEELDNLKQKLEHEQWSSTVACKLQSAEFNDLIACALYFLEKDGKILDADSSKFDEIVDWVEAMKDITGA